MRYVYMLSFYDEYGAEDVHVTLDRQRLPAMATTVLACADGRRNDPAYLAEVQGRLSELLAEFDKCGKILRSGRNLTDGWGGMQLHIVPLIEDAG